MKITHDLSPIISKTSTKTEKVKETSLEPKKKAAPKPKGFLRFPGKPPIKNAQTSLADNLDNLDDIKL